MKFSNILIALVALFPTTTSASVLEAIARSSATTIDDQPEVFDDGTTSTPPSAGFFLYSGRSTAFSISDFGTLKVLSTTGSFFDSPDTDTIAYNITDGVMTRDIGFNTYSLANWQDNWHTSKKISIDVNFFVDSQITTLFPIFQSEQAINDYFIDHNGPGYHPIKQSMARTLFTMYFAMSGFDSKNNILSNYMTSINLLDSIEHVYYPFGNIHVESRQFSFVESSYSDPLGNFTYRNVVNYDKRGALDTLSDSLYQNMPSVGSRDRLYLDPALNYIVSMGVSCQSELYGPATYYGSAYSSCDSSHSVYWNGISNVLDENGRKLALAPITSDSGFDYNFAAPGAPPPAIVPEPSTWVLLISGFGLTGSALRRRRAGLASSAASTHFG